MAHTVFSLLLCLHEFVRIFAIYSSCQYKLTKEKGVVKSPGFPRPYPNHLNCSWQIIVPVGKRIILRTKIFDVESSYNCAMDVLYIYDGPDENSKLYSKPYCDDNSLQDIKSTGNALFLRFITDRLDNAKGFKMEYHSAHVCQFTFNQSSGSFTSPNFPHMYYARANCSYLITTESNKAIQLKFHDFALENKVRGECVDYVNIYDVLDREHRLLKQLCGVGIPLPIKSSSNQMLIKFHSDDIVNSPGFNASFRSVFHLCERNEFKCQNGRCIPVNLLCNKVNDCLDNTDEVFCSCDRFKCLNHRCISHVFVCDGENHCGDWSDEKNCDENKAKKLVTEEKPLLTSYKPTTSSTTLPTTSILIPTCGTSQYVCRNKKCVSPSKRCNGYDDCGDNSDESDCRGKCKVLNGGCMHICEYNRPKRERQCACYKGFKLDSDGQTCIDINECSSRPCAYDTLCKNTPGTYLCACPRGYQLAVDRHNCTDFDECSVQNGGCQQKCINKVGSHECACFKGYFSDKVTRRCVDIDECKVNNGGCKEKCVNLIGNYTCQCNKPGYAMIPGQSSCQEINECELGTAKCSQECINTDGSYRCKCRKGFRLDSYQKDCEDINECLEGVPGTCYGCENTLGSFYCKCRVGYKRIRNNTMCVDIDECEDRNGGCSNICKNTIGSFYCQCNPGFVKRDPSSFTCEDRNECNSKPCEQICINTLGSFKCSCIPGFELKNRTHCIDINECDNVQTSGCHGSCTNTPGSFICTCPHGSVLGTDHSTCIMTRNGTGCPSVPVNTYAISSSSWTNVESGWSWQASLTLHFQILNMPLFKCMGVLVHPAFVLTTAHCVKFGPSITVDVEKLVVSLGSMLNDYESGSEKHRVKSLLFHETLDIVLIQLLEDVRVSNTIQPICLSEDENDVTHKLVASTWFSSESMFNQLQHIYVSEVDGVNCKRSNNFLSARNDSMCIKVADRRVLLPMSGSPLLEMSGSTLSRDSTSSSKKMQKWYLAGILVYGDAHRGTRKQMTSSYKYLSYTRASYFTRWIIETIDQNKNN